MSLSSKVVTVNRSRFVKTTVTIAALVLAVSVNSAFAGYDQPTCKDAATYSGVIVMWAQKYKKTATQIHDLIDTNPEIKYLYGERFKAWAHMTADRLMVQDVVRLKEERVAKMEGAICDRLGVDAYLAYDSRPSYQQKIQQQPSVQTAPPAYQRPANTSCYTTREGAGGGYTNCTTY